MRVDPLKSSVIFSSLIIMILLIAFAGDTQEVEYLSMSSVRDIPLERHNLYVRFLFGNATEFRPGGFVVLRSLDAKLSTAAFSSEEDPLLVRLDVTCRGAQRCDVPVVDISGASPWVSITGLFESPDGRKYSFGRNSAEEFPKSLHRGLTRLEAGETTTLWLDILDLVDAKYSPPWMHDDHAHSRNKNQIKDTLVRSGRWRMVLVVGEMLANIHPAELVVLPATSHDDVQEREKDGTERKRPRSFQSLVLSTVESASQPLFGANMSEAGHVNTLASIVGTAVRSCEDGIAAIRVSTDDDWGIYRSLLDEVLFECLLETGQNRDAETVKTRINPGNARIILEGEGAIARLRKRVSDLSPPITSSGRL